MRIRPPELETIICDAKYHCFIGREHCDVLSMQMDSDLVIYRTTLVRTFQVVTICRVDKSEATGLGEIPMHVGVDVLLSRIHRSLSCVDILCYLRG
ncbi:hypothetical protein F511_37842 [Dorcoceras hygrometricum]|uniref:Uncharacterized protein n=1 Tax=Dorcoceras hygrometricum TaxID=472368 RepID=A0A2Z7AD22_9LAMI|nr:hypothetical protein F511_37842 [Dorcoceras hygrometricum]